MSQVYEVANAECPHCSSPVLACRSFYAGIKALLEYDPTGNLVVDEQNRYTRGPGGHGDFVVHECEAMGPSREAHRFLLRLPPELAARARYLADEADRSLNVFIVEALLAYCGTEQPAHTHQEEDADPFAIA